MRELCYYIKTYESSVILSLKILHPLVIYKVRLKRIVLLTTYVCLQPFVFDNKSFLKNKRN